MFLGKKETNLLTVLKKNCRKLHLGKYDILVTAGVIDFSNGYSIYVYHRRQ